MHFRHAILAGLFLAFAAAPASAQQAASIELAPEQAVALRLEPKASRPTIAQSGRAVWTAYDLAAARHLAGQAPPDVPQPTPGRFPDELRDAPAVDPDVVQLRFMSIADRHALLVVENGYDMALVYRARMIRNGETEHTDVCVVTPGNGSYEHWPHPIDRLVLSDFRLVPWEDGREVTCQ